MDKGEFLIKNLPSKPEHSVVPVGSRAGKGAFFVAFSCGLLSLALEIILARVGLRAVGSSAFASTITITVFLLGSAAGALYLQQCKPGSRAKTLILTFAPAVIFLMAAVLALTNQLILSWPVLCLALLLPSFAATAMISALASTRNANTIYLVSNFGAWCGTVLAGFFLLPCCGINFSCAALAALALPATFISLRRSGERGSDGEDGEQVEFHRHFGASAAILIFLSALCLTVLECDWIRFATLILGSSSQAISATIGAVIAGLTSGNALSISLVRKPGLVAPLKAMALSLGALTSILSLKSVMILPLVFQALRMILIYAEQNLQFQLPRLLGATLLAFPTSFCLGMLFPLYVNDLNKADWRRAYTCSGAGAALGPLLFTYVLLDLSFYRSALEGAIRLVSILLAILAITALAHLIQQQKKASVFALTSLAALLLTLALAGAPQFMVQQLVSGLAYFPATEESIKQVNLEQRLQPLLFYRDGRNNTISVENNKFNNVLILKSDGKVEATIPAKLNQPATSSDLPTQSMLALLPALIHKGTNLQSLVIGQGSGTTSGVAASLPNIARVEVVELEPQMIKAAKLFPYPQNNKIYIFEADGRSFLRQKKAKDGFDLIISQPAEPWIAGSCGLYTEEFFLLAKSKLHADGLMTQWLQLYGLSEDELLTTIKTFTAVFPNTLVFHQAGAGEVILVGSAQALNLSDLSNNQASRKLFLSKDFRTKLSAAGIESWQSFCSDQILSGPELTQLIKKCESAKKYQIKINTDDNLKLEYGDGRFLVGTTGSQALRLRKNLRLLIGEQKPHYQSEPGRSEIDIEKELAQDPLSWYYLNQRAKSLIARGEIKKAMLLLKKSESLNPSSTVNHQLSALALASSAQMEEALQELQIAHQLDSGSWRPYLIAACIYQVMGKDEQAVANINKVGQICSDSAILKQFGVAQKDRKADVNPESGFPPGTLKSNLTRLLQVVGD